MDRRRNNRNSERGYDTGVSYSSVVRRNIKPFYKCKPKPAKRKELVTINGRTLYNLPRRNVTLHERYVKYKINTNNDEKYTIELYKEWRTEYLEHLLFLYDKFMEIKKSFKVKYEENITEEEFFQFVFNHSSGYIPKSC